MVIPEGSSVKCHLNVDLGHSVDDGTDNKLCLLKCVIVDDAVRAAQVPEAQLYMCGMYCKYHIYHVGLK